MKNRHYIGSRVDDFLDGELSQSETEEFEIWLKQSDDLRAELRAAERLKGFLGRVATPDPGQAYWTEITDLILARTIESRPSHRTEPFHRASQSRMANSSWRAVLAVAASLMLFFSALTFVSSNSNRVNVVISRADFTFIRSHSQAGRSTEALMLDQLERATVASAIVTLTASGSLTAIAATSSYMATQ